MTIPVLLKVAILIYEDESAGKSAAWCLVCEKAYHLNRFVFSGPEGLAENCPGKDCNAGSIKLHWWLPDN